MFFLFFFLSSSFLFCLIVFSFFYILSFEFAYISLSVVSCVMSVSSIFLFSLGSSSFCISLWLSLLPLLTSSFHDLSVITLVRPHSYLLRSLRDTESAKVCTKLQLHEQMRMEADAKPLQPEAKEKVKQEDKASRCVQWPASGPRTRASPP